MSATVSRRFVAFLGIAQVACSVAFGDLYSPCFASSLTVPDDVSTIQSAIDSNVDTVFVRGDRYPEVPLVRRPVAIVGMAGATGYERPALAGLQIIPVYVFGRSEFSFVDLVFDSVVTIQNDDALVTFAFTRCHLQAGLNDVSYYLSTNGVSFRSCRIDGAISVGVDGTCSVDSCTVNGSIGVGDTDCELVVTNSHFRGNDTGIAIGGGLISRAIIMGNIIEGYGIGIFFDADNWVQIRDNTMRACLNSGIRTGSPEVDILNNVVENSGYGIMAFSDDQLNVVGNKVTGCKEIGLLLEVRGLAEIGRNLVWGCGGAGIHVIAPGYVNVVRIANNTSSDNGGSGFISVRNNAVPVQGRYEVVNNIAYGNRGYGIQWSAPNASLVECNDWFGNVMGEVEGRAMDSGDISVDPEFCDPLKHDFHLLPHSPLLDYAGCGLIGALGGGCEDSVVTAAEIGIFKAERVGARVRVEWVSHGNPNGSGIVLERAENAFGPWIRPMTVRSIERDVVVEYDDGAVPDKAFWYRLVEVRGQAVVVIGQPAEVPAAPTLKFGLLYVGPNPGMGAVRVEFGVARMAQIELDIFDVQGRSVASLGRGVWPAGNHSLQWNSQAGGSANRAGVYFLRYKYPGGEDVRRLVRSR